MKGPTIPSHVMREQQVTLVLEGPLEKPARLISGRAGEVHFAAKNGSGQRFHSLDLDASLVERVQDLGDSLLDRLRQFQDLGARLKVQVMIRRRRMLGLTQDHQEFSGFWGSMTLPGAWPAMFGSGPGGKLIFRRGPWEEWPARSLAPLETLQPDKALVFSPYCATLFHETVGHAMESEYLAGSPLEQLIGQQVGCSALSMMDKPDLAGYAGSMSHDDCGRPASETSLVYRGFLVGDLGDANGVFRRASYRDLPLIRATNFLIGAGEDQHQDWPVELGECYYISWVRSGNWQPGSNRIKVLTGPLFLLRRGEPVAWKDWAVLAFSTTDMLSGIKAVGRDLTMDPLVHWCVKQAQPVPIGMGSPSLLYQGAWQ